MPIIYFIIFSMLVMGFAILLQKFPDPVPDVIVLAPDPIVLASTDVVVPAVVAPAPVLVKTSVNKKYNIKAAAEYRALEKDFLDNYQQTQFPATKYKDLIRFCDIAAQYPTLDDGSNSTFCPAKCIIGLATFNRIALSNFTDQDIPALCAAARDVIPCKNSSDMANNGMYRMYCL